jgi:hypothetical protein
LIRHLPDEFSFIEPCAGDGRLVNHITGLTRSLCVWLSDIEPLNEDIDTADALTVELPSADFIITNPPWSRHLLHPMIERFRNHCPTWLLFDADWMHTKQAMDYLPFCDKIVSIGRVKWIENSKHTGKDNAAWYRFRAKKSDTIFHERV